MSRSRLGGIAVTLAVVAMGATLYLYVSVTSRFGESAWPIPSKVYSDALVIRPGAPVAVDRLVQRLALTGYASVRERPARPGQYRRTRERLELYSRGFVSPSASGDAAPYALVFDSEGVRTVRDGRGHRVRELDLEPVVLATLYGPRQEERELIDIDEVPERFVQAVLAAEDARFFSHHGIDARGVVRAAWANLTHGRIVQGGSTISQQTVKNLYLGQQRTLWRKIREMAMSVILDARYSKREILEVYLNEIYLGQSGPVAICGVEAASRFYFGQPLRDLSLAEWAMLAGMIRSPGTYNPFTHPDQAVQRRLQVLQAMQRLGYLDASAVEKAAAEPLHLAHRSDRRSLAPYAVDYVQANLAELYPRSVLTAKGLQIYTTIDPSAQLRAESALENGLQRLERDVPSVRRQLDRRRLQGAVIQLDPSSGAILALVGGRDYAESQFNRVVQAKRQPGSCFKPFVFATGFERAIAGKDDGLTAATVLEDRPFELISGGKPWSPANYDRTFRGPVTVREALEASLNVPTVRAAQRVGLEHVVETAHRCGIRSSMAPLPSLALGTAEVTPLELATAFGTFANGGTRVSPRIIRAVTDADGKLLEGRAIESERVLHPETAFLINELMMGVFERGTARSAAALGFPGGAAGKTGTTDDTRDSWFVGYTEDRLTLAWVGYDDNSRTGLTGATGALPIWVALMTPSAEAAPLRLEVPRDVVTRKIDPESGLLAVSGCPEVVREYFVRGTEPERDCPLHRGGFKRWLRRLLGRDRG